MSVVEGTSYEGDFSCLVPAPRIYRRCNFNQLVFRDMDFSANVRFEHCSFRECEFAGCLRDNVFTECTFHIIRFSMGVADSIFDHCAITRLSGPFSVRRTSFLHCSLANSRTRSQAVDLQQCRFHTCSLTDSTFVATSFTDCRFTKVTFLRCAFPRAKWRRTIARKVTCVGCNFDSGSFGAEEWTESVWKECTQAHAHCVGSTYTRCRTTSKCAIGLRVTACTFLGGRTEDTDYKHTVWEASNFVDCTWVNVSLDEAHCNKLTWTNCTDNRVTNNNTLYSNVARHRRPTLETEAVFLNDRVPITMTLYSKHYSLYRTEQPSFRLRHAVAQEIDCITVKCTPSWWSFGFSAPQDAHDTVSHILIGDRVYYASRKPYLVHDGNHGTVLGYRLRARTRSYSL